VGSGHFAHPGLAAHHHLAVDPQTVHLDAHAGGRNKQKLQIFRGLQPADVMIQADLHDEGDAVKVEYPAAHRSSVTWQERRCPPPLPWAGG